MKSMYLLVQLPSGSGFFESIAPLIGLVAGIMLILMLVALAGFAYKSLSGDGIRWPDEEPEDSDGAVRKRNSDDDEEWKYY